MSLEACPKCGNDNIFVPLVPAVGYDGTLYGGRTEGFCNSPRCDQRFWYYPRSGRITRRNNGMTLKDYRLRWVHIDTVNAVRRNLGLAPLRPQIDIGEAERAATARRSHVRMVNATTLRGRFGRWLADWRAWIAAYCQAYWPFKRRKTDE